MDLVLRFETGVAADLEALGARNKWTMLKRSGAGREGYNVLVSDKDSVTDQVHDAMAFLSSHASDLEKVIRSSGQAPLLDFGVASDERPFYMNCYFPAPFLRTLVTIGVELNVSVYQSYESFVSDR